MVYPIMSDREHSIVDLNEEVLGSLATLRNLLGDGIAVSASLTTQLEAVRADPSAFREAILHVVANANKSMPNGGCLDIETENVNLASRHVELGVAPGKYVCLTISSTGAMVTSASHHLPSDYSMRLFLAPIYAFAKRFGGTATIQCEPNQGTTVSLYLPTIIRS